jgi:hypothetical protein
MHGYPDPDIDLSNQVLQGFQRTVAPVPAAVSTN